MAIYYDCLMFKEVKGKTKKRPVRIGSAKQREDGGFQVYLDALPPDGQFAILPQRERSEATAEHKAPSAETDDEIPF